MVNTFDMSGKVVAITGGGGVLCSEMAVGLAAAGASVAVMGRTLEPLQRVVNRITRFGGKAVAVTCDVLEKAQVEAACGKIIDAFGRIDVLINGAGGNKKEATTSSEMSFFDIPTDAIKYVFDLNFIGTLLPSQVFGKAMAKSGKGRGGVILNVSSMSAIRPLTKVAIYGAAKAAINNFTQWLAVHMCQHVSREIRVNAIAPGFFLTEQNRFLLTDEKTGKLTLRGETIVGHTPMGRFGEPGDLLGTVLWLCSDASKFVTGVVVPIDGGFSAFSGV
ncbi:MAG: SDR family oxidoreductase [Phycisphaerales bacterium]|nr:SDR family oxidoreductase [Phycisphaerales bacterium]